MPTNTILPDEVKNKYTNEIMFIRNCARNKKIKISPHCYKQMAQRKIIVRQVYQSIRDGVVMEVQSNERDIKILFQDSVNKPPMFFVAVAVKSNMGFCVTAYLPDPEIWELDSGNQWRRKQDV